MKTDPSMTPPICPFLATENRLPTPTRVFGALLFVLGGPHRGRDEAQEALASDLFNEI